MAEAGILYGVGVGPGDPELITFKALRLLQRVPVIAYPAPPVGASFARRIAAPHLPGGQIEVPIRMPLEAGQFPDAGIYAAAAATIGGHLQAGRDVAVLCEGDPFVYGSFAYLCAALIEAYPVRVIPGITALTACAAAALAPLALRDDTLVVVPGLLPEARLAAALAGADAAVIVKVGRHLPKVRRVLAALGLEGVAIQVERATLPAARVRRLTEVSEETAPYFTTLLVHRRGRAWR